MKTIITGAAGFIGSAVAEVLAAEGVDVLGVDNLCDYYDPALKSARLWRCGLPYKPAEGECVRSIKNPCLRFVRMDISSPMFEAIVAAECPDMIIHLAARPGVRQSIDLPEECIADNIGNFMRVLEICRRQSVGHLLYASSSSIYGDADPGRVFRKPPMPELRSRSMP